MKLKPIDVAIVVALGGVAAYALWRVTRQSKSGEAPADVQIVQRVFKWFESGTAEDPHPISPAAIGAAVVAIPGKVADSAEAWGDLLSRYIFEPAAQLPQAAYEFARENVFDPALAFFASRPAEGSLYGQTSEAAGYTVGGRIDLPRAHLIR